MGTRYGECASCGEKFPFDELFAIEDGRDLCTECLDKFFDETMDVEQDIEVNSQEMMVVLLQQVLTELRGIRLLLARKDDS